MKRSGIQVMANLIALVRPLIGYMFLAVSMGLLGHLCATGISVLGGMALLRVLGVGGSLSLSLPLSLLFLLIALCAVLRGLLRYGEQACNHFIAFKLLALLRDRVFAQLRRLCPAKLEGQNKGDLIHLITSDIELLEVFYAHTISPICIAVLYAVLVAAFLWQYHPVLSGLLLFSHLLIGMGIPCWTARCSGDVGKEVRNQTGQLSGFVLESLRGLSEIQQYGRGQTRLAEMVRRGEQLSLLERRAKGIAGHNGAITNTLILLLDFIMLYVSTYVGGSEVALITTLTLMGSFGPCVALAALGATLQNTFAAGNRVLDLLEEQPGVEELQGYTPVEFAGVSVEDLCFAYQEEEILSHLNLQFPQGKIVGILGRSGSGKSTLLKLLMRFWEAKQGEILISDRSIRRINTENLRALESYVTQETHLFHDTIRNNLLVGKLDATQQEIEEACRKASILDWILSLPAGFNTQVAELGDSLSGGERQRLGLARAFMHQAPLLLLDEPTSNLDSLNEAVILCSLQQVRGEQTVVLVSHRESTMGIVDQQYCVEQGRMS